MPLHLTLPDRFFASRFVVGFLTLLLLSLAPRPAQSQGQVLPGLKYMDLRGGQVIRLCDNQGTLYDEREWEVTPPYLVAMRPCAVVKNATISVDIQFTLTQGAQPYSGTVSPDWVHLGGHTIPAVGSQPLSLAPGESKTLTFTVGPFPPSVRPKSTFLFRYRITMPGNPSQTTTGGLTANVYVVHSTPVAPQVNPWVGVLDDSCGWAIGCSTDEFVKMFLVSGLYNGNVFEYAFQSSFSPGYPENFKFRLKDFLALALDSLLRW